MKGRLHVKSPVLFRDPEFYTLVQCRTYFCYLTLVFCLGTFLAQFVEEKTMSNSCCSRILVLRTEIVRNIFVQCFIYFNLYIVTFLLKYSCGTSLTPDLCCLSRIVPNICCALLCIVGTLLCDVHVTILLLWITQTWIYHQHNTKT